MGYFEADAEEMLEVYLLETRQLTAQLGEVLLEAEKKGTFSDEEIHSIFRIMHTIKSSSAMMGLGGLSSLAHKLEDLFSYYREKYGKIEEADPELFDLLFAASDYIDHNLKKMTEDSYKPGSTEELERRAQEYLEQAMTLQRAETDGAKPCGVEGAEREEPPEELRGKPGMLVRVVFENGCRMENIRAFMLVRQIGKLCDELETFPDNLDKTQEGASYIEKNGVFFRFRSNREEEVLEMLQKGLFVDHCEVIARQREASGQSLQSATEQSGTREAEFLNIRTERLDHMQNLSAELLTQMMILDSQLEQSGMDDIKEGVAHRLNRLIGEVDHTVMEMRLVPVSGIIPKLRRILRDICRNQNKEAELIINCGDVEADKSVVEYASEALMHLIRNAVDHGIESPKERRKAGKNGRGKIIFTVESTVGELFLSIQDDGKGIDEEKVRETARKKKLFVRPEQEYSRQEVLDLILTPGFSTNEEVTEYSGRGVGLDVVKNIMDHAGGHFYMKSEAGKGSTFTLSMPMTLATMECVRFRVGEYRFSLPARHVYRFLEYGANRENIQKMNGQNYILYEGRMVPLIDLREFYSLPGETPETSIAVYVEGTERGGCVLADAMYEQKRIVIKPLPTLFGKNFRADTGIGGFSITGSGRVCTALDTEILIERYERREKYAGRQA